MPQSIRIPVKYVKGEMVETPPAEEEATVKKAVPSPPEKARPPAKTTPPSTPADEQSPVEPSMRPSPTAAKTEKASRTPPAVPDSRGAPDGENYRDLYLRAMADMANFRRRTEQRAEQQIESERRRLLQEFLEVADNLERALDHLDEPRLREGLRLTYEGLKRFLEHEGVEPVSAEGRTFDPEVHEAVATVPAAGEPGRIVEQVRKGYHYRGRLLRPARVVVSR
jgi:molecular chaperone GrpE